MTGATGRLRPAVAAVGWPALYAGAMGLGLATRVGGSQLSLAWPAAAVSVVWLLSTRGVGRRAGALAILVVVTTLVNALAGFPTLAAALFGAVNALHAVTGVAVLAALGWRTARPPRELRDVGVLALASITAGSVGSVLGGACTALVMDGSFVRGMAVIGSRNAVSTFVGVATLLAVPRLLRSGGPATTSERVVLVVLALASTVVVTAQSVPVLFLLVPLTGAVAMRCGPYVASVLGGAQGFLVVVATLQESGEFALVPDVKLRFLLAQVLIVVLVLVGLVLSLEEQERSRALERSGEARARLEDHVDAALVANAYLVLSPAGRLTVTTVNPALADLCRSDRHQLIAMDPLDWFDPSDRESFAEAVEDLRRGRSLAWRGELRMAGALGGGWVDAALSPVRGRGAEDDLGVNLQLLDITARKRAEHRLANLALHDQLTGLPNRALVVDRLQVALAQARRTGLSLGVLYVDIDRFKQINDTRGHDAGDQVLQQFGNRLVGLARAHDTIARLGGDEFVMVCPAVGTTEQAQGIAARVLLEIAEPFLVDGEPLAVSASVGLTLSDGHEDDVREVLRRADAALYEAKEHGRSRYEVFQADGTAEAEVAVRLLDELRRGFEFGDIVMEYQPIVELAGHRTVGLEALVRWRHPSRGVLYPRDFLSVVESSDLVFRLGEVAVHEACRDGAALVAAGHRLAMHVNLSARELERPATVENVRAVLEETGFPPELLTLEITETRMLNVSDSLLRDLGELRRIGVRVAVDDFGTGYSGPAHLVQMPVDALKLDRSFVACVEDQRSAQAVSSGVLAMARGLGIGVIAEGIETEAQERALLELGYELGQGYLYSAALPAARIAGWLDDGVAA